MSGIDDDIEILEMLTAWSKKTSAMMEALTKQKEQALAEGGEEAAERVKLQFPPCPVCGAEVTSYEVGSIDGPLVMAFRPCDSKVMRDPGTNR